MTGAGAWADDVVLHRIHLSGGGDAASGARAAIDLITVEELDATACDELRLMVSELVSNAVQHGGALGAEDDIELIVTLTVQTLRVECSDPVGGFDVPAAISGYGLSIIDSIASAWGVRHGESGSTWFEFAREGHALPRAA